MSAPRTDPATGSLTRAAFHILLALAEETRHGLGIADAVEDASDGAMRLGPGTLYRSLKELAAAGLVHEVRLTRKGEDPRRKFYRITAQGRRALRGEAERYERWVRLARGRNVLPERAK